MTMFLSCSPGPSTSISVATIKQSLHIVTIMIIMPSVPFGCSWYKTRMVSPFHSWPHGITVFRSNDDIVSSWPAGAISKKVGKRDLLNFSTDSSGSASPSWLSENTTENTMGYQGLPWATLQSSHWSFQGSGYLSKKRVSDASCTSEIGDWDASGSSLPGKSSMNDRKNGKINRRMIGKWENQLFSW